MITSIASGWTSRQAVARLTVRLRTAAADTAASVRHTLRTAVSRVAHRLQRLRRGHADGAGPTQRPSPPRNAGTATASGGGPPKRGARRLARRLSVAAAVLLATASASGLVWQELYQDAPANAATFRAYDLGSLAVATPLLVGALIRARQGSFRADLLWAGMLAYVVYTYAYYVFGAALNALFLVHVALFVLAAVALVLALRSIDLRSFAAQVRARTPVRAVSAVLTLLSASLGGMWTWYSLRFAATGAAPHEGLLLQPAPIGHLGYAMDLSTLVPGYATASVLLWQRRPWGYVLGTVLLVASAVIQVNYMLALAFQAAAGIPGATGFDPQEPYVAAVIAGGAAVLLGGLRHGPSVPAPPALQPASER